MANEIVRSLEVHAPDEGKYRRLIIQAAYLSRHTLDDEWLRDAIEDTRRKRPQSVWGYFRACLASGCDSRGFDLDQLLVATKVPVKFLTRA